MVQHLESMCLSAPKLQDCLTCCLHHLGMETWLWEWLLMLFTVCWVGFCISFFVSFLSPPFFVSSTSLSLSFLTQELLGPHISVYTVQMADRDLSPDRPNSTEFLSWNVKAMNSPVKRTKIFADLKKLKANVVFSQETSLLIKDNHKLQNQYFGLVFQSQRRCNFNW